MLDVKIGSLICFLLYTLQEMPRMGGKHFTAWYANHKMIADDTIRWITNIFWGYVGLRVLNPGLYSGVLIYLFVLGVVRAILLARKAREKRLQEAINSFQPRIGWISQKTNAELTLRVDIPIPRRSVQIPRKSDGQLIAHEFTNVCYEIKMGNNRIDVFFWVGGVFYPELSKKRVKLEDEKVQIFKNLKKFEFARVLDELIPILKTHAARP